MRYLIGRQAGYPKGHPLRKSVAHPIPGSHRGNGGGPYVLTDKGPQSVSPSCSLRPNFRVKSAEGKVRHSFFRGLREDCDAAPKETAPARGRAEVVGG
jgi:hypothetical protein